MGNKRTLPTKMFGKTGCRVPVLGLGTGPAGMGLDDEQAEELYRHALDIGVTYIDTAPGYDHAHTQLKPVLKERRDEVFLATKVVADTEEKFREGLEKGLHDLGVEYVDLFYIHSLGQLEWETLISDSGSLKALFKAKEEGLIRNAGFTAHNRPGQCAMAVEQYPFDAVMLAMNFADRYTYGFEHTVLPKAAERGMGIAAMKLFGGADEMEYKKPAASCFTANGFTRLDLALRYGLTMPHAAVSVVGVYSIDELDQIVDWTVNAEPLSSDELQLLEDEGKRLSAVLGPHFGPVD